VLENFPEEVLPIDCEEAEGILSNLNLLGSLKELNGTKCDPVELYSLWGICSLAKSE
jgi:hypothetical protein